MTADDPRTYEGWTSAFHCSTDFEADLVRDRLDEAGIPAVVLTQRDHSFNLNVGELAPVHVMVKPDDLEAARAVVADTGFTDAELEAAAMSADVMAPDAQSPEGEAMLDSGMESLSFDVPDDDDLAAAPPPAAADDTARPAVGHLSFATAPTPEAPRAAALPPAAAAPTDAIDDPETAGAYDPTRLSGPPGTAPVATDSPAPPSSDPDAPAPATV